MDPTPTPTSTPRPKLSEAEHDALQHESYLMQIREHSCNNCQSGERWSELFEVWISPSNLRRTSATVLRPSLTIRPGMSVAYLKVPTVVVPICSDCVETFNPLEGAAIVPAASHSAWLDTIRRKYAAAQEERAATPRRPEPSLDQL